VCITIFEIEITFQIEPTVLALPKMKYCPFAFLFLNELYLTGEFLQKNERNRKLCGFLGLDDNKKATFLINNA
jgi:hypothetical protein